MALYAKVICVPGIGAVLTVAAQAMLHRDTTAQTATILQIITLYQIPRARDKLQIDIYIYSYGQTFPKLHLYCILFLLLHRAVLFEG